MKSTSVYRLTTYAFLVGTIAAGLAACQTAGSTGPSQAVPTAELDATTEADATEIQAAAGDQDASLQMAVVAEDGAGAQAGGACHIALAGGPPPKPARGADFGEAVVKNTGKAVQRGIIQQIGARIGGGLGSAVGGAIAQSTVRAEQDIKGIWMITDGRSNCACELHVDGLFQMQGKGKDAGSIKPVGCASPQVASIANWALGYSFTGYDAKFDLKPKDKRTVLATLNRDGIHYFSGTLTDGTPVTMWRDGQNYMEMKRSAK